MPKVGDKKFPYTKKGKGKAKKYADKTGLQMMFEKEQDAKQDKKDMKKMMKKKAK